MFVISSAAFTSRGAVIEKILPLNRSIVSKIEKISQDSQNKMNFNFSVMMQSQQPGALSSRQVDKVSPVVHFQSLFSVPRKENCTNMLKCPRGDSEMETSTSTADDNKINLQKMSQKSGSFESALPTNTNNNKLEHKKKVKHFSIGYHGPIAGFHNKSKQSRRLKLQFDDQNFMDCGNINDFLSSSSLSSSDSEKEETNESDHEGDDELTDWPGNEAMVNFASKNEFRRANKKTGKMPQIKQQEDIIQDDDTLMSADEIQSQTLVDSSIFPISLHTHNSQTPCPLEAGTAKFVIAPISRLQSSHPINIIGAMDSTFIPSSSTSGVADGGYGSSFTASYNHRQPIESEMSGETSTPFMSSIGEVREIRAGCRRIREERPGFSIITSFNEELLKYSLYDITTQKSLNKYHLFRFLQDEQQKQMKIFDIQEYDKILELAKL